MQAKGEFEYVGQKVVGTSCDASQPLTGGTGYCLGVPNKEFRLALARPFLDKRLNVGVNMMIASGWTGQTTENFAAASVYGPGKVGIGTDGLVPADPVSEVVGVRIPSYASVIESVQVDGGAYNVREGNHALNLAAIYGLRSHLDPFLTLTGDYRDITATAGMSLSANSWVATEGSFGNGFLDRLEHRKQRCV